MHYMKFSSELKLDTSAQRDFWLAVIQSHFCTPDGVNIAFAYIEHPDSQKAIVISNGRVESYIKYKELMFDLYQQGFSVYALDHRGQGLSDRLTHNPHQGYVEKFSDYTNDLNQFITEIVAPNKHKELFMLAHSMGSTIATDYIHHHPNTFTAAVFSAPMLGIKLPFSPSLVRWLANKFDNSHISNGKVNSRYVLGGSGYQAVTFKRNQLTHSKPRYLQYRNLFDATPKAQLGSPTNRWLLEAMKAADQSIEYAKNSKTPILILQAEKDSIVCNKAQNLALSSQCHKVVIEGAYHEVFIETDQMRNIALSYTLEFMAQHSKTTGS
ncbi:alpha/beta fold hydrolase [Shewanella sp.]|jgi:lysophospholipase|uniref:alpha/beta fold hydrolase n=1 Tax=Shewanella sp. TaxID=50422 RepID=UPI004048C895